jgi:hypothetical protein
MDASNALTPGSTRTEQSTAAASSSHSLSLSSSHDSGCSFAAATLRAVACSSASSARGPEMTTSCSVDAAALCTSDDTYELAAVELCPELEPVSDASEGVELPAGPRTQARACALV